MGRRCGRGRGEGVCRLRCRGCARRSSPSAGRRGERLACDACAGLRAADRRRVSSTSTASSDRGGRPRGARRGGCRSGLRQACRGARALARRRLWPTSRYESFCQSEIARLEERADAALEDRIDADLSCGASAELVAELQELVARHPLRERLRGPAHARALPLGAPGRRARRLPDARRALVDELGIEPEPRAARAPAGDPARRTPELDLRGRGRRRRARAARWSAANASSPSSWPVSTTRLSGRGRLFLIAGEPGIGKSRLADELARPCAQRAGRRYSSGRCWEAGGAPAYWPWVQALRAYVRETDADVLRTQVGVDGADLATLLPELSELVPDLPAATAAEIEGARFRVLESVASFLQEGGVRRPLVVILDDLHAADAPSLLLLRFVAGELAGAPILIVGCYRDTEVGPLARRRVAEISREPAVHRLSLRGLSAADTSRLLELTMGDAPADGLAARVHAETAREPAVRRRDRQAARVRGLRAREAGPAPDPGGQSGRRSAGASSARSERLPRGARAGLGGRPRVRPRRDSQRPAGWTRTSCSELSTRRTRRGSSATCPGRAGGCASRTSWSATRSTTTCPPPGGCASTAHRRGARGRLLPAIRSRTWPSSPTTTCEPGAASRRRRSTTRAAPATARPRSPATRRRPGTTRARWRCSRRPARTTPSGTCELLLALGERAQPRRRTAPQAKEALRRAAALAERAGRPDQLARAALGLRRAASRGRGRAPTRPSPAARARAGRGRRGRQRRRGSGCSPGCAAARRDDAAARPPRRPRARRRSRSRGGSATR